MIKNIKEIFVLGIILVFAGLIYTYKLSTIPNGFYVDEAVVAYNAISIADTQKDIFGQKYPVLFRLLGSYTPPLFIYVSEVYIKFVGFGITSFRSISVISALVSIIFFYLTIKKIHLFYSGKTYLITTFLYSISPWLVFNARLGYEVTIAYTLFNIGVYFFVSGINKAKNLIPGLIFFSLSTYAAHTQRFLAPIFVAVYLIVFRNLIFCRKNINNLIVSIVLLFVMHIPHFSVIGTPAFWVKNERFLEQGSSRMIANITNQTFAYISPVNLFSALSDIDAQHTVPEISVMYNWMVIPYLIGLFVLIKNVKDDKGKILLILFTSSLIPAVLSGEFISIQRALPFLFPLMIVIGLGIDKIIGKISPSLFVVSITFLLFYSLTSLYRSYFVLFPKERAEAWNYGYSQIADYIKNNPEKNILLDNSRNPRNYILLLYFLDYPANVYQEEVDVRYKTDYYNSLPPEDSYKFSNIEVRTIDWKRDSYVDQIIIGDPLSVSNGQANEHFLEKVYEVKNPLGNVIFNFYRTNPDEKCNNSQDYYLCK